VVLVDDDEDDEEGKGGGAKCRQLISPPSLSIICFLSISKASIFPVILLRTVKSVATSSDFEVNGLSNDIYNNKSK
jgi:hypothetical protein